MRRVLTAAALATVLAAVTAPAPAAELPPVPVLDPGPDVFGAGEGLYVRGDAGYVMPIAPRLVVAGLAYAGESLDKNASFGLGLGYDFGWLRADLTGDVLAERSLSASAPGSSARAKLQSLVALANLYVDLGTWSGITPYVGAGAGLAVNRLGSAAQTDTATGLATAYGGGTSTRFAWALMAGAAIDVTSSLKLDVGYRFADLGNARGGGGAVRIGDLRSHEVRLGLRFTFD